MNCGKRKAGEYKKEREGRGGKGRRRRRGIWGDTIPLVFGEKEKTRGFGH